VPYAGVRKVIGDRLSESKFTAPHLYFTQKVDLQQLLALRKQVNEAQDKKTSVTDFIAKAVILSLQKYPEMNASLVGEKIVKYKSVNLGIAVASPTGLIVPNIKDAQNMSVVELSKASSPLFEKAREGKLAVSEYTGGTFTVSNLGMFGIENFTAIINPPEVGILAVSSTKDEPLVVKKADGTKSIEIRPMMNIQLSVDHRIIDGLLAAQVVTEIKTLLEDPIKLLV
jgi:pyruvate dehydrogenase E2 component (dihydrolipoamide acetyltransferase)